MESRRPVHYKGNTVEPHISQKCKDRVKNAKDKRFFKDEDGVGLINPNKRKKKVVATTKCNWCDNDFKGVLHTICPVCRNCQYCGFFSHSMNDCISCGNTAPEDIRVEIKRIKL